MEDFILLFLKMSCNLKYFEIVNSIAILMSSFSQKIILMG
jgi:hypothetical protein